MKVIKVVAAIIHEDHKILIAKRNYGFREEKLNPGKQEKKRL